ncbi:NADPH-dependent FMN reductase [Haloferula chungangensis]|uniref:NADPH-dependent FMN reductase n=1 Tax=Haloferula chungangensis TaxID=1048331 RepID=A0ABW2L7J3_9BACT
MKVLALAGSTSSTSINRQLANHAAHLISGAEVTELDLRKYELPIYSSDEENEHGIPTDAHAFLATIRAHDAIVISLAEHNGSYAAAFKNLYDWTSRIDAKLWSGKPMLLMATSPGAMGGRFVLEAAEAKFPRMGADLRATFSLPSFYDHFSPENGITHEGLAKELGEAVRTLEPTNPPS